jgi:hypothetical protein
MALLVDRAAPTMAQTEHRSSILEAIAQAPECHGQGIRAYHTCMTPIKGITSKDVRGVFGVTKCLKEAHDFGVCVSAYETKTRPMRSATSLRCLPSGNGECVPLSVSRCIPVGSGNCVPSTISRCVPLGNGVCVPERHCSDTTCRDRGGVCDPPGVCDRPGVREPFGNGK